MTSGDTSAAGSPKIRGWRKWTLSRQLVVAVCAVVMAVQVIVGALTVFTVGSSVRGLIDTQLASSAEAFSSSVTKFRTTPVSPSGDLPEPGAMKPLSLLIGQSPGNVIALVRDGMVLDAALYGEGEAGPVPPEARREIAGASWTGPSPSSMHLPGLGWYRVDSRPGDDGETLITAVSLDPSSRAVARETAIIGGMTTLALVITALATVMIVRYALRPLRRVAATAAEVAALPLSRDNHTITPRVPEPDISPGTEVGLVGDTLNRLLDHVEQALSEVAASDRRMRQFITDASHELRTPLAAIHGYAELTRQDSAVLPDTTEYALARIEAETRRMNSLVADLLLLARLDEGQDLTADEVELADLVVDAVNDAAVSAPSHRWVADVGETEAAALWVRGDRARLHQLLANLLSNARVHTPHGTTVTTALRAGAADNGAAVAELTVTDDGPGIPEDLQPHLFERFVRADKSRSRAAGSFGLGLAIAASIVEAHRGSIAVSSGAGRTTFRVRLPLVRADAPDRMNLSEIR
ncbi:MAG: HAMP domain-containing histidine kinase [Actinobacteria bacterium]|nr:HAMP domain-containing histidine kinase [Actinomycetota bacterium]